MLSPFSFFLLEFLGESRQFPGVGSSLHSGAGLEHARDESCGGYVEDETGARFWRQSRDNKKNEICRFAENLLPLFGQVWLSTAGPLISLSVFFAEFSW